MATKQLRMRRQQERNIRTRLTDLFSQKNPGYLLNGGAALNMVFSGRRVPADIDLRCDDIETVRKALADRYEMIRPKPTSVQVYCFVDENGVIIDLSQDVYGRAKSERAAGPISLANGKPLRVITYDFEQLLAEKLIALARKADAKDLFDLNACLSIPFDRKKMLRIMRAMAVAENADPLKVLRPDFSLRMNTAQEIAPPSSHQTMLGSVQNFLRAIIS
jgi:predicted nucleotidyltransferase component of viral defense system